MKVDTYLGVEINLNDSKKFVAGIFKKEFSSYESIKKAIREVVDEDFKPFDVIKIDYSLKIHTIIGYRGNKPLTNEGVITDCDIKYFFILTPELKKRLDEAVALRKERNDLIKDIKSKYGPMIEKLESTEGEIPLSSFLSNK